MSDDIAEPMSDNTALRELLGEVRQIDGLLRQQYDAIVGEEEVAVTGDEPYTRAAMPTAVKTVITNTHAVGIAHIYEEGALVRSLLPGETWVSPLNGAGEITVEVGSEDSEIAIATYTRTA